MSAARTSGSLPWSRLHHEQQVEADVLRRLLAFHADEVDASIERTLLKELVLKYADAEKKLAELNQLKNRFLGMAAHDLRSPLSAIIGLAEMLQSANFGPVTAEQKDMIQTITGAARQMLALVNDLLDVAAIESGKVDLCLQECDMREVVEERVRMAKVVAAAKNISLRAELEPVPESRFDPARMAQVVDNLLSNAIKFSPAGSTVDVRVTSSAEAITVAVTDEGPGLSTEDREHLFGEFTSLSAKPTGGEKSTGLGLAIARKIVEAHGGTIGAEQAATRGTRFFFRLPRR